MAVVVDRTAQRDGSAALGIASQARSAFVPSVVDYTDNTTPAFQTAGAMFMLDTLTGEIADELITRHEFRNARSNRFFNPYSYFQDNADSYADFPELDFFVRRGFLHGAQSPEEFEARANAIRRELERRALVRNGGFGGIAIGSVLSFADVTTMVPVIGWGAKVGMAGKAAIGAINATAMVGGQELLLHQMQAARTAEESFIATGVGTVLGGGVGAFAGALSRRSVLHPLNPQNPVNIRTNPSLPINGSISAADVRAMGAVEFADDTGLGPVDAIGRMFRIPTAVAREIAKHDPQTAGVLQRIVNLGMPTKANEAGIRTEASADELMEIKYRGRQVATEENVDTLFWEMQKEMGSGALTKVREDLSFIPGVGNEINKGEFDKHVYLRINDPEYETGNAVLDKYVAKAAAEIEAHLDSMFDDGVRLGLFAPEQRIRGYMTQRWVASRIGENPREFEAWLLASRLKAPDDDWLMDSYGLTREQFERLPDAPEGEGPSKAGILEDWNVEKEAAQLRLAEAEAEAAEAAAKQAVIDFKILAKEARKVERETLATQLKNVRASVAFREARLATERERLEQLKLEEKAFIEAATAARQRTLDRQQALFRPMTKDQPSRLESLEDALGRAPARSTPEPEPTLDYVAASARAQEIARQRLHQESKVRRMSARLDRLRSKADEVEQLFVSAKAKRKDAIARLRAARKAARVAGGRVRKAKAQEKALATRKDIPSRVREISRILRNRGVVPSGLTMFKKGTLDPVFGSNRAKARGIVLTPEETRYAVEKGWLDTNISHLLHAYTKDVGGRLAMLERFGSVDLEDEVVAIQERFADLIAKAPDAKAKKRLRDLEQLALAQVELLRNRVLGTDGLVENPETFLMYLGRNLRMLSFLRSMGGTLLSSLTDLATTTFSVGGTGKVLRNLGRSSARRAKGMKDWEVSALLRGADNVLLHSRAARNLSIDDLEATRGFGSGLTRRGSGAVEGGLRALSEKMSVFNGMAVWNRKLRVLAGDIQLQNIVADAKKVMAGGTLDDFRVTEYARFGVDLDDLKGIARMIAQHGEIDEASGLIDPNGPAWHATAEGTDLHDKLLLLLKRATQEAVIQPTHGDLPPFMSSAAGKLLGQFQTYGFAVANKYVRNLRYGFSNGRALEVLMNASFSLALGAVVYALKEGVVKGNALSDKPGTWVYEAVDRSGITMFFMPFLNGLMKLGAPALESLGLDVVDLPSRYARHSWLTAFLGPWFGVLEDVEKLGSSLSRGEWGEVPEKVMRLAPYSNLFYFDAIWRRANGED